MKSDFQSRVLEPSLLYGGIIGVFTIVHSVIVIMTGATYSTYNQIATYIIPVIGLAYCLPAYRREYLNDQMPYGKSFVMGLLILFVAGLISLIYTYVYISFINPDFFRESEIVMEEKLLQKGMDPDMIETIMERTSRMRTPKWTIITSLLFTIVYGAIVSLIVSAFTKKESEEPFKDVV